MQDLKDATSRQSFECTAKGRDDRLQEGKIDDECLVSIPVHSAHM